MLTTTFHVALGGAIGSALRFVIGAALLRGGPGGFPVAVLTVNVIGSILIGICAVWTFHKGLTHLNPILMTGVLGGFTTFSAFSLEALTLFEKGAVTQAAIYVVLSVVLSLLGVAIGVTLARGILA